MTLNRGVEEQKPVEDEAPHDPFSFSGRSLSPETASHLGVDESTQGVYIELPSNQSGSFYGLEDGMVITTVNGKKVTTIEELKAAVQKARDRQELLYYEAIGNHHWKFPDYRQIIFSRAHTR